MNSSSSRLRMKMFPILPLKGVRGLSLFRSDWASQLRDTPRAAMAAVPFVKREFHGNPALHQKALRDTPLATQLALPLLRRLMLKCPLV